VVAVDRSIADDLEFSDDELTALALAADPTEHLDDDAVPLADLDGVAGPGLLPDWYMPVPASFGRTRKRKIVISLIVGSLLVVNALGLCVTSGFIEIA